MSDIPSPRWLLALESSTAHGGAALFRDGECAGVRLLPEGLRHGRELVPAAAALLADFGVEAAGLWGVAVSTGPGSYTGVRVGVMAAKALAYGSGARLAGVSSLAGHAASLRLAGAAAPGELAMIVQDARRDEVYLGLYRIEEDGVVAAAPDAAVTPEEAAERLRRLRQENGRPRLAGSGFATYATAFAPVAAGSDILQVPVNPAGIGWLGWRQILREEVADPLALQPRYLRRDEGADWRHDELIRS